MPGQEDMDLCTDKVLSKGRILQELTKAIKLVTISLYCCMIRGCDGTYVDNCE